jgi:DNA polymerase (family X)
VDNKIIVGLLEDTARLLELHNADPFKIRAFGSAGFNLDKVAEPLADLPVAELTALPGVGKSMAQKIRQIIETGQLTEHEELLAQTPAGVLAMYRVKGLGSKKIRVLWQELGVESLEALQAAAEAGEVAKLKGFGKTTQDKILHALEFLQSQTGKVRMDKAADLTRHLTDLLTPLAARIAPLGPVRWLAQEVDTIQLLLESDDALATRHQLATLTELAENERESSPFRWRGQLAGFDVPVELTFSPAAQFDERAFVGSAPVAHLQQVGPAGVSLLQAARSGPATPDEAVYARAGLPYVVPEMRENDRAFAWAEAHQTDELVTWADLRGSLHNHSTWSDGKQSIREMAEACRELGLSYFGIADHSPSAGYANGLEPDRVVAQQLEIDAINAGYTTAGVEFRVFKGIESDIRADGSLDYDDTVLATFDYVVASVHQNLTMPEDKATARLLRAIENPYTTILGHPTGRLLLARAGYPIDHRAVIDACARHGVVIEINASPYRLDLDWHWIDYALSQNVLLAINPDAHERAGLLDMHYGVTIGRKGGLTRAMTFNAISLSDVTAYFQKRKSRILT